MRSDWSGVVTGDVMKTLSHHFFHPLPVEIDGQVLSELHATAIQDVCRHKKWFVRVVGE